MRVSAAPRGFRPRRRRLGWLAGAVALWALLVRATPAAAQSEPCPLGRVSRIEIRNYSLFAPADITGRRFSWALGLANSLHIRTRADYLERQMLLEEGECYDPEALEASVRYLRELDFIARVQAEPRQVADSTWAIDVQTWDEWSTSASVYFDVEGELQIQGFYVTEVNALGRGLRLSFRHRAFRERNDNSVTLASTRFLGSATQASVAAGTTRTGRYFRQDFTHPLQSETSRLYFLTHLQLEDREQSYLTGDEDGVSHVLLPLNEKAVSLVLKRRSGVPGALTLFGGELQVLRRTLDGPVRQVIAYDFRGARAAPDSIAARLRPQESPDSWIRLGATVGLRRIRFTSGKGLDLVSGVQNVALGSELTLTVGRTLGTWGSSSTDTYGSLDGFVSGAAGALLANTSLHAEGRFLDFRKADASRWRDLRLSGRSLLYVQPGAAPAQAFVLGARFNFRDNTDQPYQVALGGEQGVRAYREDQVPTASTFVAFAEERINLPWFHPAVDLGLTAFVDHGRGWADDIPFGQNTGWRTAVGGGIRLGFPAGSGSVTRVEVAWPVGNGAQGRGPVIRTYFSPVETSR